MSAPSFTGKVNNIDKILVSQTLQRETLGCDEFVKFARPGEIYLVEKADGSAEHVIVGNTQTYKNLDYVNCIAPNGNHFCEKDFDALHDCDKTFTKVSKLNIFA